MINTLLILFSLVVAQDKSRADNDPTAKSVVSAHIKAIGGKELLLKTTNYSISGKFILVGVEGERVPFGEFQIYQTNGRFKILNTLPDGTVMSAGTDGKIAWSIDEHGTAEILKGQVATDFIRDNSTVHESLSWEEPSFKISYAGRKDINGVQTNHLIFVAEDNRQINRYFSTESGLLLREERFVGGNNVFEITTFAKYEKCKMGILVSRRKIISSDTFGKQEYQIDSVNPNIANIEKNLEFPELIKKLLVDKNNAK